MGNFPVYSACDLISKENSGHQVVVHELKDLLTEEEFIPSKPHRHTYYQILFVEKGSGIHKVDFNETEINAPVIYFLSPGQVHDLVFERKETEGYMINFDGEFFDKFLTKSNGLDGLPFFGYRKSINSFHIETEKVQELKNIFKKINSLFEAKSKMHVEFIRIYLLELFYTVMSGTEENTENINITNQKSIIYRFENLVEQNYTTEHYPKFYADKLAITANYLNFICKNFSGKKAGEIIRDRVILEAKRLLVNSEFSISQIAFQLGFDDNSYFTKFFKTFSGNSPSEFRNNLNK
jgi:AraC-like DNA-binding protein